MRLLLFLLLINFISCKTKVDLNESKTETIVGKDLKPFGRYDLNGDELELITSACHFGFEFKGKECKVYARSFDKNAHGYIQYEVDGKYIKRVRIADTVSNEIKITTDKDTVHQVWIYKATEAHSGPLFIQKIEGSDIVSIERPKKKLIEFIGNSITCAAAADDSDVKCNQGEYHDQHSAYFSYASRVARALDVNYILNSVSGIGIYRNWNSEGPTMPMVYDKTDFQLESNRSWDFSKYTADVISIALGTNDYSDGDGGYDRKPFDKKIYTEKYIDFVKTVKAKNPKASIILLSSPMINGDRREILQSCLTDVKNSIDKSFPNDKPVTIHFFKEMQPRGCSYHPSVEDHEIMAKEVMEVFVGLLK